MRTMHLFAGAGGGLLADLILGNNPVCAVEIDPYCCAVLRERAAEGWFPDLHVHEGDVREFDFKPWRGIVDCITAGFPCQDISAAGKGEGITGSRSGLVSEVWRAIDTIRPAFVFLENSPSIRTRGRHEVIRQLVARGYSWKDRTLAASDVGAGQIRKRWWCLAANADSIGSDRGKDHTGWDHSNGKNPGREEGSSGPKSCVEDAANTLRHRLQIAVQQGGLREAEAETIQAVAGYTGAFDWSPPDIGICRVVDGLAHRIHRIKALGNGQVPIQAAAAWIMLWLG